MSVDAGGFPSNYAPFTLSFWVEGTTAQYAYPNALGLGLFKTSTWTPVDPTILNINVGLFPKGAGGIHVAPSDSTATGGNPRGAWTLDFQLPIARNAATQIPRADGSALFNTYRCGIDDTSNNGGYKSTGIYSSQECLIGGSNWNGRSAMVGCYQCTMNHPEEGFMGGCQGSAFTQTGNSSGMLGVLLGTLNESTYTGAGVCVGNVMLAGRESVMGNSAFTLVHGYQAKSRGYNFGYYHGTNSGGPGGMQYARYMQYCRQFTGGAAMHFSGDGGALSGNSIPGPFPTGVYCFKGRIFGRGATYSDLFLAEVGPFLIINNSGTMAINPVSASIPFTVVLATGTFATVTQANFNFATIISPGASVDTIYTPPSTSTWLLALIYDVMEAAIF